MDSKTSASKCFQNKGSRQLISNIKKKIWFHHVKIANNPVIPKVKDSIRILFQPRNNMRLAPIYSHMQNFGHP